jgi:hypothetical protein
MLNFCTLFDSNYLTRGLLAYESLMRTTENKAHLYVFAFDDLCAEILEKLRLPNLTLVTLAEFEDEELLKIKPTRSRGEYCWTCTSSTIYYCLKKFNLENCTYIDADLFFYGNPQVLIDEMGYKNVLITEHRYTKNYDQSVLSGKYCVQFMYFDNSPEAFEVLVWWRDRCLEWCYNRHEDGKFGDQKYLDDWLIRFPKAVHVLENLGGGLAPWNVQQYSFNTDFAEDKRSKIRFSPIFFHFHGLKYFENGKSIFAPHTYILAEKVIENFYKPYLTALQNMQSKLSEIKPSYLNLGVLSAEQYKIDWRKGWGAYFFKNYLKF